jgi:MFS family permease
MSSSTETAEQIGLRPTQENSETPQAAPWRAILAICACASLFALMLGITQPLLSLILASEGISETMIGLNSAMGPLGLIVSSPLFPPLGRRLGAWRLMVVCLMGTIVFFLALGTFRSLAAWFGLRFALGVAINGLFIVSETWVNQLATNATRGRVMGLYATLLSMGFGLGPLVLRMTGIDGWAPFWAGTVCAAGALLLVIVSRRAVPVFQLGQRVSLVSFLPLAPVLLTAVAVFSIFDSAHLSLLPIFVLAYGLTPAVAMYALTVLVVGNIFLQFPIGWLGDLMPRRMVMVGCALIAAAGSLALPLAITRPLFFWPLLFVWGGVAFGIYTMALAELGERFSGASLLAGNASFALMWGLGGIVGPPLAGWSMEAVGPDGLAWTLGATFLVFTIVTVLGRHHA